MSVSGLGEPGKEVRPGLCPGPAKGGAPWNHLLGVFGFDLSALHPISRGRPEGLTRLAVCIIEGRTGWSGVEP